MLSSLVLAVALLGQCRTCDEGLIPPSPPLMQIPQQQYNIQVIPVQPRYYRAYPQVQVIYLQSLRPGDIVVNERVGLFGWRTELRIYRMVR